MIKSFLILCAFSISTRTPLNFISTKHGNNCVSVSKISQRSSAVNCFFISFHKCKVATASCSAYSPTYIAGKRHISFFGLSPHSLAASYKAFSFLPMPTYSLAKALRLYRSLFSFTKDAAIIVSTT